MLSPKREGRERRGTRDSESERKAGEELCKGALQPTTEILGGNDGNDDKNAIHAALPVREDGTGGDYRDRVGGRLRHPRSRSGTSKRERKKEGEREGAPFWQGQTRGRGEREMKPKDHLYIGRPL